MNGVLGMSISIYTCVYLMFSILGNGDSLDES